MIPDRINYLHFGKALSYGEDLELLPISGKILRRELRQLLKKSTSSDLREVLGNYGSLRSKIVDIDSLRTDFERTLHARNLFINLKCRGFSYATLSDFHLEGDIIRPDINVRIALLPELDLFYPSRLRRYLQRGHNNHIHYKGFESIAFALATIKDRICEVLIMQSDLARRHAPYVREHFRGWRKVLFLVVVNSVQDVADSICLFRASDVAKACHRKFLPTPMQISTWESIYDRTAEDFGLQFTELESSCNLQIYAEKSEVHSQFAYVGRIKTILGRFSKIYG